MGNKQFQYTYCPIISRCKDNQIMKFSQLVEYNMRNIFLEKSNTKWGGETNLKFYAVCEQKEVWN